MDGRGYNSLLSRDQVKIQLKFIHSFLFLVPFSANENKISLPISVGTSCLRSFFSVSNIVIESIDLRT